jgi:hypothetical protein
MLVLSRRVLRVLLVLNWLFVAAFAALLVAVLSPAGERFVIALSRTLPADQAGLVVSAMAWLMVLGIVAGVAAHIIFRRMLEIIAAAIAGDPFTRDNARKLRAIGWALLVIQCLDLAFGSISIMVEARTDETFGWSPTVGGWIAVLMVFVLARVFEQGSRMRDELAMTV